MSTGPYQQREQDQREPGGRAPLERGSESSQLFLVPLGGQADERELHHMLKEPEHRQPYRQAEDECSPDGVAEMVIGPQSQEVMEVRRHAAHHQC